MRTHDGPAYGAPPPKDVPDAQQLAYIADLIDELRLLVRQSGCQTLSGLLNLAHREAVQQQVTRR
jgi:hypothetical protein